MGSCLSSVGCCVTAPPPHELSPNQRPSAKRNRPQSRQSVKSHKFRVLISPLVDQRGMLPVMPRSNQQPRHAPSARCIAMVRAPPSCAADEASDVQHARDVRHEVRAPSLKTILKQHEHTAKSSLPSAHGLVCCALRSVGCSMPLGHKSPVPSRARTPLRDSPQHATIIHTSQLKVLGR